ncbi:MAG: tyrosine-protein kinase [Gaiellaceae bacterium]|nr:tyrosine-protein kinase [Gaiellaceae bacterium]
MEATTSTRGTTREDAGEQQIELRRYLDALRRSRWPIALTILGVTAATLVLSLALPKTYSATAKILFDPTQNPAGPQNADAVLRQLSTLSALITTPPVLAKVAARHDLTVDQLRKNVSATASPSANLVNISVDNRKATDAAAIANDVARTFIATNSDADRRNIEAALSKVRAQIGSIGASRNGDLEVQALRSRISDLTVALANAGSEISLAEAAEVPKAAASPRPVLNALLAFFASTLLAILIAIGRDQLVPRISGPRELTRITDRPVIVGIPFVRGRLGRRPAVLGAAEHEAFQTLQASIRFELPAGETQILLVTSAIEGEGKTTVTANLARALARAGRKTLVIGADMRRPRIHELFGVNASPGFSEILTALEAGGEAVPRALSAARNLIQSQASVKGNLHVLSGGKKPHDPARLLLSPALMTLLDEVRLMGYDYVLLDGTPLIGLADSQALAQRVDEVLIVSRLDRLTVEDAVDLRDLLDRLDITPLGHAVVGARRGVAYSYATGAVEHA